MINFSPHNMKWGKYKDWYGMSCCCCAVLVFIEKWKRFQRDWGVRLEMYDVPCLSVYELCVYKNLTVTSNKRLIKYKKESNHSFLMSARVLIQVVLLEAIYLKSCSFPGFHCTLHVAGPKWRRNSTSEMHPTKRHPQHSKHSGILFTFNIN